MAQFLENVVFSKGKRTRKTIGILEQGDKVKLTGCACDSFFIDQVIGWASGIVDEKTSGIYRYVRGRLNEQFPNNRIYVNIHNINVIEKNRKSSLYVSYDVFMKSE